MIIQRIILKEKTKNAFFSQSNMLLYIILLKALIIERRLDIMTNAEKALQLHEEWNGKFETTPKMKIQTREDLALAYTPGVAEPCKVIAKDKEAAYKYTIKSNTIAVVSDGSAVLGLGNIGAHAAMPVMEGKAVLFKEFGNVNAVPVCLDNRTLKKSSKQ